ncbi:hypothetical protein [Clostridium sp. UBA7339]|uniref:hypothetical protein n=1 Tax=Clostridium sp. UBA7339 TaxID=1946376 RepID=UPI00321777AB
MSIISGIFPSEIVDIDESGLPIYDRAVDEEYFAKYHSEFLSNGVYANPSNNFQVMVNDLMKLKVKAGSCFINGYYAYDNFDGEIILEPASSDLNRIDRIVTRLDRINRKISIEIKKGAYGTTSYSAPSLQRDDDIWELGLADVLVKKGTTQIVQANITDLRAIQEYCGYVYNPMQNIDTTDLFAQYDNSFEVWFQHVKDQLSTDAAGNLQKQIDTHTSELAEKADYKYGTWTPVLYTSGSGSNSIGANTTGSTWVRIGNLVIAFYTITVSSYNTAWSSQLILLKGLPYVRDLSKIAFGNVLSYYGVVNTTADTLYLKGHTTSGGSYYLERSGIGLNSTGAVQLGWLNQSFGLSGILFYQV